MTVCWLSLVAIRLLFERIKSYLPTRFFPTPIIFCAKKKPSPLFYPLIVHQTIPYVARCACACTGEESLREGPTNRPGLSGRHPGSCWPAHGGQGVRHLHRAVSCIREVFFFTGYFFSLELLYLAGTLKEKHRSEDGVVHLIPPTTAALLRTERLWYLLDEVCGTCMALGPRVRFLSLDEVRQHACPSFSLLVRRGRPIDVSQAKVLRSMTRL